MRFLVFTDLHQKKSAIEWINAEIAKSGAEFVVCLGDVTDMGTGEEAAEIISGIKAKVYCLPGNCDARDMPQKVSGVCVDMHGKGADIGGYRLCGIGGSNITIFNSPFELTEDELYDGLKANAKEGMILMTHVPSYGILDQIPSGQSVGSPAVKRIVDEYHPILAMSGHIHEAIGVKTYGGTTFVNPGPAMSGYAAVIDIVDGKVDVRLIGPGRSRIGRKPLHYPLILRVDRANAYIGNHNSRVDYNGTLAG